MKLDLIRFESTDSATFGVLMLGTRAFCLTLERPWKQNMREVSCIPEGTYLCKPVNSPHFGPTWEIQGVPGRANILFHKGNYATDSKGCILLGKCIADFPEGRGISQSKEAFLEFSRKLAVFHEIFLTIRKV
jgi:hypothetical protein